MDSAVGLSDTVSVTPSESASNVGAKAQSAPSKSGKSGSKRSPKAPADKDAPPGAVQVAKGGSSSTSKKSQVTSATIPLSGWGEIDLSSFRKDIEPTFTVDARPYGDLVDTVYQGIQSRYSAGGKHIPRSLFRYYCFTMWWLRVLWLHKANGNVLTTEEKNFLNILTSGEDFEIPSHIAQYLANLGNFLQGNEQYYFRKAPVKVGFIPEEGLVTGGWFVTPDANNRVEDSTFWIYSQFPSPAVSVVDIVNEANNSLAQPGALHDLGAIAPAVAGAITVPTDNIVGWSNAVLTPHHSSWRATFSQLGWGTGRLAPDLQTTFNVSTSTLKWVSERLSTLKDYKVHSSKQLTLSTQGHPMLAYWLGTEVPSTQRSQFPPAVDALTNHLNGSRFSDLAVLSRYAIDTKILAPAFSFGYRIERSLVFATDDGNGPQYINLSNYQPWILVEDATVTYQPLTPAQLAGMNDTFVYGSLAFINVRRFATHELNRSVGLDAALILSSTK